MYVRHARGYLRVRLQNFMVHQLTKIHFDPPKVHLRRKENKKGDLRLQILGRFHVAVNYFNHASSAPTTHSLT